MTNKDYLKKMKEAREKWIDENNLSFDKMVEDEICDKPRIAIALEIIAEMLIDTNRLLRTYIVDNDSLAGVITTLENIETALNRR